MSALPKNHFRNYMLDTEGDWPGPGTTPTYSRWKPYGDLKLKSDWLWLGELMDFCPEAGKEFELGKGVCEVLAKGASFGPHRRIAALRFVRAEDDAGPAPVKRGRTLAKVDIDQAILAACDLRGMMKAFGPKEHGKVRGMIKRGRKYDGDYGGLRFQLDNRSKHTIYYAKARFGDGTYSVFDVRRNGTSIGVEIEFIGKSNPDWKATANATRIGT